VEKFDFRSAAVRVVKSGRMAAGGLRRQNDTNLLVHYCTYKFWCQLFFEVNDFLPLDRTPHILDNLGGVEIFPPGVAGGFFIK
jgi:hypothetical protein